MSMQHGDDHRKRRMRTRMPRVIEVQPGQVAFRLVCHDSLVGGVIGSSGSIISLIRRDTSCVIHCDDLLQGSDHRVILVVGPSLPERRISLKSGEGDEEVDGGGTQVVSGAQEAVLRVLERMWEVEAESGADGGGGGESGEVTEGYCGILADTSQIGAVVGRGGKNVSRVRRETGAHIRILPAPLCAARDDELIQITGAILAVKKALVAVTGCLQDCPPFEKEQSISARSVERGERVASHRELPDPHSEFFPHLSSLLPSLTENSGASSSLRGGEGDSNPDSKAMQREVSFRLLCSNGAAGSIIGKKGAIVRALQNQTGASIRFAAPLTMFGERVVTVSAMESLDSWYSPAQNAVVLVFARSVEFNIENGRLSGLTKGTTVTARLLVASDAIHCLSGSGDRIDSEMTQATGADISILEGDQVSIAASQNDVVIEVSGEYKNVQNALFQVTSKLRGNFMPSNILKEVNSRDPCGTERESTSPRSQLSADLCLNSDQESSLSSLTRGMDKLGLSNNKGDPTSTQLHSPQKLGREYTSTSKNNENSLTTGSSASELERSLHFLLPREVLNEVGERSSTGVKETTYSGLYSSFGLCPASNQETVLTQENNQLGCSNSVGCPSGLQLPQSVGRGPTTANPDIAKSLTTQGRTVKPERKRTAIVANTTVEIIVSEDIICSIYGEDGNNLARLKQISGAKVEVRDPSPGKSEGMVIISGTPDQTRAAESLLQAFILDDQ